LSFSKFINLEVVLPTLLEQEKIVEFLSCIDEKIKNVSNELEKMEEFKKGLLQSMFV
jgi:type I restriction enzyme, S subunit